MHNNRQLIRTLPLVAVLALLPAGGAAAADAAATYHHVHLAAPSTSVAVKWYSEHLDCEPIAEREDSVDCSGVEVVFVARPTLGGSPGTGVDHIAFSFADLSAKMEELEGVGVRGSGVRLQRFDDGSTLSEAPGWFKHGFIFDPWGTRIELVEDAGRQGFHHVHLRAADPRATRRWYRQVLGGKPVDLEGEKALAFGSVYILVSRHPEGTPAPTEGRSIDHLGFVLADLEASAAAMKGRGVEIRRPPEVPENGRSQARRAFVAGPDGVGLAVVEPGWAGVESRTALADIESTASEREPYETPLTPWGEPDLQGIWTGNAAHGIPLERPEEAADKAELTPEEAAARRERGTLGSIWGYEREWRDTTLGYVKSAPSTQVAMVIDPPDGRLPPLTEQGKERAAAARERRSYAENPPAGPEDLTPFVRCITRGLPGLMMPGIYNNGLQIVQSPGFVAIQKEMIHETRIIPTEERPHLGPGIKQWLGDSRGRWEGETLVVEVTNFNGKAPYRGAGESLRLTERYTRVGPNTLEYRFTVDDPTMWTRPWTGMFHFERDDAQYELVEYACHEGNYGMSNILSGARAKERAAAEAAQP